MGLNFLPTIKRIAFVIAIGFFSACDSGPKRPDVSDVKLNVTIQRFDNDLFALQNNDGFDEFKESYTEFLPLYSNKVIGLGDVQDENFQSYLNKFITDSTMNLLSERVKQQFPTLENEEEELEDAFKHIAYYYPSRKVPKFYSQISGFNQSIVVATDLIGISLDKYLGKDCEFYSYMGTPMYARENMIPMRIAQDVVLAYALTEFPFQPLKDDLISNMIYQGKIRYFVQSMMPDKPAADVMKYTKDELAWCKENEEHMWGYIIEQKHLFNTNYRTIIKYINDGPFTAGMPEESPSRTGIWLGWQIVQNYMDKHEDYSLVDLMKENDYALLLRESGYQP